MIKKYLNRNFLVETFIYNMSMASFWLALIALPVYLIKDNSPYFIINIMFFNALFMVIYSIYKRSFYQYNSKMFFIISFISILIIYSSLFFDSEDYFHYACIIVLIASFNTLGFMYLIPKRIWQKYSFKKSMLDIMKPSSEEFIDDILKNSYKLLKNTMIENNNILYIPQLNCYLRIFNVNEMDNFLFNKKLAHHNLSIDKKVDVYPILMNKKNNNEGINLIKLYNYMIDNDLKFKDLSKDDLKIVEMYSI